MKTKNISPEYRECFCGCGRPGAPVYSNINGHFSGYRRYARECIDAGKDRVWLPEAREKLSRTIRGMGHPLAKPMKTTREGVQKKGGKLYRWIKAAESGKWQPEHRYVMEQHLGIKLTPKQQVHHINGDGLDNRIENLMVVSPSEHAKITCAEHGDLFRKYKKTHKCPLCKLVHNYPLTSPRPVAVLPPVELLLPVH
jgi:HNH endonuclease